MDDILKNIVDGYEYASKDEADKAANEINGIKYVREKTDMSNPRLVFNVYNKMLEKNLFKTMSGYNFLRELQEVLLKSDEIDNTDIKPIKAPNYKVSQDGISDNKIDNKTDNKSDNREDDELSVYKSRFVNSLIIIAMLVVTIIAMVVITTNSKNLNIINYKTRLDAMYNDKENNLAIWDVNLKKKEEELRQKENELNLREEELESELESLEKNEDETTATGN